MRREREEDIPPIDEEEHKAMDGLLKAIENGDKEAADRFRPKIKAPPHFLKTQKRLYGAEGVRARGYNTELADKLYGPDWLDRDDI